MIRCHECKEAKPFEAFARNSCTKTGYNGICRECKRIRDSKHYVKNRDRIIAHNKEYNRSNREWLYEYNKEYNQSEAQRAYREDWRRENPKYSQMYYGENKEQYNRYRQEYRSRQMNNGPTDRITISEVFERDAGICQICKNPVLREDASMDHIIALINGGTHTWDNIQLAHLICNKRKGSK